MAFNFRSLALSRIVRNSAFCCSTGNPGFEGQLMLPTVAIHAPRNSRIMAGGTSLVVSSAALLRKEKMKTKLSAQNRVARGNLISLLRALSQVAPRVAATPAIVAWPAIAVSSADPVAQDTQTISRHPEYHA